MNRRAVLVVALLLPFTLIAPAAVQHAPTGAQGSTRSLAGAISCATSHCHGGTDLGQRLSEFTTWRSLDPHAHAYHSLISQDASRIAANLWPDGKTHAHEAPLCLKCHVHPDFAGEHVRPNYRKEDGVGCESCHGSSRDWREPHYRPEWKNTARSDKQKLGLADTKSLLGRVEICVRCHVGTPGAEVDHELIAAGHPALRFEYATYFANLPPHWDTTREKKTNSSEVCAWQAGQLLASASALDLLAHHADPENVKPWPELAHFDCFSCHHDLQGKSWRQKEKHVEKRRPGSLTINDWYLTMLPDALHAGKSDDATRPLTALRNLMERRDAQGPSPFSDKGRRDVARRATELAKVLRQAAATPGPVQAPDMTRWLNRSDRNWDEATQRYLALMALRQTHADNKQPPHPDLERLILELRKDVTFSKDHNSSRSFVPSILRSPK